LPFCGDSVWLVLWLFLVGACSGAFYPLGLTLLGERVPRSGLARANAWYLAINCIGSLMGPDIMGEVMDQCGMPALFLVGLAAVVLVPVVWIALALVGLGRRREGAESEMLDRLASERAAA
jgi:MFS family permease